MTAPRLRIPALPAPSPARLRELAAEGTMSVKETQAFLGLSQAEVYRLLGRKVIASAKCGRRTLVSKRSVREFLESRMTGG